MSVTDIIALGPSFLQLPYEARCDAYKKVGVISSYPITRLSWWIDDRNSHYRIPVQIPVDLYFASKELSADVQSVWWSENVFRLYLIEIIHLLHLATPMVWSSLRYLQIISEQAHLPYWRQVCNSLRDYSPPYRLTLRFCINMLGVPSKNHINTAREALHPMLELPVLKTLSFDIAPARFLGVEIHHMATYIVKRHIHQSVKRPSPIFSFQFMNLPVEIQIIILEYTDLVAPGPVTSSTLKGYVLDECYLGICRQRCTCCEGHYDSLDSCWRLPVDIFHVNKHIRMMSEEVFFSRNPFIVDVQLPSYPAPLTNWNPTYWPDERIPGLWSLKHSNFLLTIPPGCIPILRSLTWRFPKHNNNATLTYDLIKHDWICTIDFIAENVRPLSRLTLTLDMTQLQLPDEVMLPVRKLQDLRGLFVRLPGDPSVVRAAEELRLQRLAMGRN